MFYKRPLQSQKLVVYPPASLPSPWSRDSFFSLSNLFRPIQTHIRRLNQPTIYTSNSSPSLPLPRFHLRHRATTTIHHVELIYTKIFIGLRFRYRDTRHVYIHIYIYEFLIENRSSLFFHSYLSYRDATKIYLHLLE